MIHHCYNVELPTNPSVMLWLFFNPNRYCIGSFRPTLTLKSNISMMAFKKNSEVPIPRKMYLESFSTGGEFAGISSAVAVVVT